MVDPDNNIGNRTRWDIANEAVSTVLTNFDSSIRFGLMLFPSDRQGCDMSFTCQHGAVFIDPQPDNGNQITSFLGATSTCGRICTPIAETLNQLPSYMDRPAYPGLKDASRENYVLLITDGEHCTTCWGDPTDIVRDLRNESPEIKTFVVGFGTDVAGSEQLNMMADAGGTARPGEPRYYQAESAQDLDEALAIISGAVLSCDYALTEVPPNSDELSVYFNNTEVARNAADGWEYNPANNHIVFSGNACTELQSGQVTDLKIIFGCPDDIIIVD
ncbi:MAG: hypothetical protein MJE77_41075 [Proteobacteria bacterium]|nr:hypothetical protein [Pseudomonadota bacterium]